MMELIKNDIAHVISNYMKIDTASMDIQITKTGVTGAEIRKMPVLYANILILDLKNWNCYIGRPPQKGYLALGR